MRHIGEKLKKINIILQESGVCMDELEKLIGRFITSEDGELGMISGFDYDSGLIVVEFGSRYSTMYKIQHFTADDLINGKLELEKNV